MRATRRSRVHVVNGVLNESGLARPHLSLRSATWQNGPCVPTAVDARNEPGHPSRRQSEAARSDDQGDRKRAGPRRGSARDLHRRSHAPKDHQAAA
jgi:hypothetical protein